MSAQSRIHDAMAEFGCLLEGCPDDAVLEVAKACADLAGLRLEEFACLVGIDIGALPARRFVVSVRDRSPWSME